MDRLLGGTRPELCILGKMVVRWEKVSFKSVKKTRAKSNFLCENSISTAYFVCSKQSLILQRLWIETLF